MTLTPDKLRLVRPKTLEKATKAEVYLFSEHLEILDRIRKAHDLEGAPRAEVIRKAIELAAEQTPHQ